MGICGRKTHRKDMYKLFKPKSLGMLYSFNLEPYFNKPFLKNKMISIVPLSVLSSQVNTFNWFWDDCCIPLIFCISAFLYSLECVFKIRVKTHHITLHQNINSQFSGKFKPLTHQLCWLTTICLFLRRTNQADFLLGLFSCLEEMQAQKSEKEKCKTNILIWNVGFV